MAIVGALARVDSNRNAVTRGALDALPGVSTFDVEDPDRVGVLIESADLQAAHELIRNQIPAVDGVLGAWPVFASTEDEEWNP